MIILDMDGVLADFTTAANIVCGAPPEHIPNRWDWYEDFGLTEEQFWARVHSLGDQFYGEFVKPYPWAQEVMQLVREADDFVIMSSPSDDPVGYAGKKIWLDRYIRGLSPKQLIVGSQKHLLAGPDRLLIDDGPHNIEAFAKAGGNTHTFLQPWNCTPGLCYWVDRIENLKRDLSNWGNIKNV